MEQYCSELDRLSVDRAGKEALAQWLVEGEMSSIRQARRPTYALRPALIAACLALALAVGAVAAGLGGAWQRFFPGSVGDNVTQVGASAITGDYTLTLEEAIVDEDGAAFLLALTRTDGGVLEGKPRLSGNVFGWDVKVDGKSPNMGLRHQEPIRSQDGRAVYYCVEFQDTSLEPGETLIGREITFVCKGVADVDWSQEEMDRIRSETVSLAPMADAWVETAEGWEELTDGAFQTQSLDLLDQVKDARIPLALGDGQVAEVAGVIFTADGPAVAASWLVDRYWQDRYLAVEGIPYRLIDTRTGESWGMNGFLRLGDSPETYLSRFPDCPLTAEDLPYVELMVYYQMEKVLSDQRAELTFLAEKGGGVTTEVGQRVAFDAHFRYEGNLNRVRVSSLGLRIDMEDAVWDLPEDNAASYTAGRLVMKDGAEWSLCARGYHMDTDTGRGWLGLEPQDAQGDRALIDPAQVKTLVLGECEIELG